MVLQLRKRDHREVAPAVNALVLLVRRPRFRVLFASCKGTRLLPPLLRTQSAHLGTLYNVCLSLWLLTFDRDIAVELTDSHAVAVLHDLVLRINREKIVRVALAILANLVTIDSFAREMISVGVFPTVRNMAKKKFGDADIPEACAQLAAKLDAQVTELSTFDSYLQEVLSGRMDWTPAHRSEAFWRDNIDKFEASDFRVVRELVALLGLADLDASAADSSSASASASASAASSTLASVDADARTVAVACHDLGEFVRHHARGRKVIAQVDAKTKIMHLMTHQREEIRKEALLAVQKMMVQNWDFM